MYVQGGGSAAISGGKQPPARPLPPPPPATATLACNEGVTHFTCFTSAKVQIVTLYLLLLVPLQPY